MKALQVTHFHIPATTIKTSDTARMTRLTIVKIVLCAMVGIESLVRKIVSADANIVSEPDLRQSGCTAADCRAK